MNDKFKIYYEFLVRENEKYNLTAITEENEVNVKHFEDSLSLLNYLNIDNLKVCDVGSGAGFPGIPLKIMNPTIKLTIIEPTLKRCNFLKELCKLLDIDVTIINKRSEEVDLREEFDIVVARAVAKLNVLLELCIPLTKVNGHFIAYKGSNYKEEIQESKNALKVLKTKVSNTYTYSLNNNYGERCLIDCLKEEITPTIYPRMYSKIKKNSL